MITPGEWEALQSKPEGEFVIVCDEAYDPQAVATVHAIGEGEGEVGDNARLIAASPDLLAACKELRAAFLDGCGEATKGPKRARLVKAAAAMDDAIAKAEGG